MAAGALPPPGTEFGPCEGPCEHPNCAQTRKQAETVCGLCPRPIGYDTRFYNDDARGLVHAACLEAIYYG